MESRPGKFVNVWARQNSSLGQFRLLKVQRTRGTMTKQSKRHNLTVVTFHPKGKTRPEKSELFFFTSVIICTHSSAIFNEFPEAVVL